MNIECLDKLVENYNNIVMYPILGLYLKDKDVFTDTYMVINETNYISICNKQTKDILTINKLDFEGEVFNNPIIQPKKSRKKIFKLGKLELYKTNIVSSSTK